MNSKVQWLCTVVISQDNAHFNARKMPTCGSSYFEFNKLKWSIYNSGSFDRILQENRSIFHLQPLSVNLIVIGTHTQRGIKTGVKSFFQGRIFPVRSEDPTQDLRHSPGGWCCWRGGMGSPRSLWHHFRAAMHILGRKPEVIWFLIVYNYLVDSRILCHTQIFTPMQFIAK